MTRIKTGLFVLGILETLTAGASDVDSDAPSAAFNHPGQARTRTCVTMKKEQVPLRFPDGTPTGWFVRADDPSKQGGNQRECPRGTMEMDVHEILTTGGGMRLFFHPGGGPSHYRDWAANGQYGHIALEDILSPPPAAGDINGKPAPFANVRYLIAPTRIPHDMWYKPNVSHGHSGSTYYTYGNPGYDKTGGRGDWTYINWSWVQNGGPTYPKNKCGGGGMVRALGKRDSTFWACRVEPIIGYSYGADNQVNGRVTVFYGRLFAGPGEKGDAIYGWTPHSYQKIGELIVPCVRRAAVTAAVASSPSPGMDLQERMAWNLLHPTVPGSQQRHGLLKSYSDEREPIKRMELLTELARMDDDQTVTALLGTLSSEREPRVREQAIVLFGFLASTASRMSEVSTALAANYARADEREKARTLDVVSNFAAAEAGQWVVSTWRTARSEAERSAAADAVLKLVPRVPLDDAVVRAAKDLRGKVNAPSAADE